HHSPKIPITLLHGCALPRQIGFDEEKIARTPNLELKLIGVRPGCRPQDLTLDAKLCENLAGLIEGALHVRPWNRDVALKIHLLSVAPEFRKPPRGMVQEQATEGKQPDEKQQKQSGVEMQFAIPPLESGLESSGIRRLARRSWFSG